MTSGAILNIWDMKLKRGDKSNYEAMSAAGSAATWYAVIKLKQVTWEKRDKNVEDGVPEPEISYSAIVESKQRLHSRRYRLQV